MEQQNQQMTLLERAIKEANEWLEKLEKYEESSNELLDEPLMLFAPEERFAVEDVCLPQDEDSTGEWFIGLAGHGWNNLYFCCRWRSQRLKIAVQVSYQSLLTTDDKFAFVETEQRHRKRLLIACSLICLLLKLESEQQNYIRNNVQGNLTVVCDDGGCAYCLCDETGVVSMEKTTDGLLNFLHKLQLQQDFQNDVQFFMV